MQRGSYIHGLSGLRFALASWVVFSHVPFPFAGPKDTLLSAAVLAFHDNIFCGAAAVIAFFLVSGLCIHFPQRNSLAIDAKASFLRRTLRIGIPLACVYLAGKSLGVLAIPIWSIYCEEIYYFLYPLLLKARVKCGSWRPILWSTFFASMALALLHPEFKNYWENGPLLTWMLGLPCWVLGCKLAEEIQNPAPAMSETSARSTAWRWRVGAIAISTALSVLRFHSPLGYPLTLNLFAFYIYAWLRREIAENNAADSAPVVQPFFRKLLERAGKWSYSLYVVHEMAAASFEKIFPWSTTSPQLSWPLRILFTYLCAYVFYWLIEGPSHTLARRIKLRKERGQASDPDVFPLGELVPFLAPISPTSSAASTPSFHETAGAA